MRTLSKRQNITTVACEISLWKGNHDKKQKDHKNYGWTCAHYLLCTIITFQCLTLTRLHILTCSSKLSRHSCTSLCNVYITYQMYLSLIYSSVFFSVFPPTASLICLVWGGPKWLSQPFETSDVVKVKNMLPVERCQQHLSTRQKMPPASLPRQKMPKTTFSQPYITIYVYEKD